LGKGQIIGLGRTAEIFTWGDDQILKLFRDGWSRSSVEKEEKITRTVYEAGLPAPAVHGIVEVEGRHGIIYERVDGPSMLEELISKPGEAGHFVDIFAKLHAEMHSLEVTGLPSQRRQIEEKIRAAEVLSEDGRKAALKTLHRLPDGVAVCHGDFHPDNILMSPRGPVIIDWVDATKGNPHADIARTILLIQQGELPPGKEDAEHILSLRGLLIKAYLRLYSQIRSVSLEQIEAWRLPIAAVRLSERIPEEESRLLSIVERLQSR